MIKQPTHRHGEKRFSNLVYRVKGKHVFMQSNGEWIKSSVEFHELERIIPLAPGEIEEIQTFESKPSAGTFIARHKRTKAELRFRDINEVVLGGFDKYLVLACLNGKKHTHKGYIWREAA